MQDNVTLLPSSIVRIVSEIFTNGATEENRTKHTMLEKILGKDFRVEFYSAVHSEKKAFGICAIVCSAGAWHKNSQN